MSLFKWSNNYSVGVATMDDHHKHLFDIVNKLYDTIDKKSSTNVIESLLNDLIQYTEFHFREEERLMEKAKYSGLFEHRNAHQVLINKMKEYKNTTLNNPDMTIFIAAGLSMTAFNWVKDHILEMDKAYESDLKTAGFS